MRETSNQRTERETLIETLQSLADEVEGTPTLRELQRHDDTPGRRPFERVFGSWNNALWAAGLDTNRESPMAERYDRDELLTHIKRVANEIGRTPPIEEFTSREDTPSVTPYFREFDTWNNAVKAAGLTPNPQVEESKYSRDDCLEWLRAYVSEFGVAPKQTDLQGWPGPSVGVYYDRFGSVDDALREAGITPRGEVADEE